MTIPIDAAIALLAGITGLAWLIGDWIENRINKPPHRPTF